MKSNRPTKRGAAIAVSNLIDQFGPRLIIECVADYLRIHAALDVWAVKFDGINALIESEARAIADPICCGGGAA